MEGGGIPVPEKMPWLHEKSTRVGEQAVKSETGIIYLYICLFIFEKQLDTIEWWEKINIF